MVVQIKIAKLLLTKVLPIALVIGAAYFFIIRPIQGAAAAPAKAVGDAVETVTEAVESTTEAVSDIATGIGSAESFSRPPGTGGGLAEGFFGIGAEIQRALTGGLTWREQAVLDEKTFAEAASSLIYDVDQVAPRPTADPGIVSNTNALNLQYTFGDQQIADRFTSTIRNELNKNYSISFGGYGSAVNQEAELRKAIEESKAKYGEWFK